MLLPYPLKTPPLSSSALRTDNPGSHQGCPFMFRCIFFFGQLLLSSSSQPVQNTGLISFCGSLLSCISAFTAPRSCCSRSPPCLLQGLPCHPPVRHDGLAELPEFIPALVLGGHRGDQILHVYLLAKSVLQFNPSVCPLRTREEGVLCIVVRVSTVETAAVAVSLNPLPIDTENPMPG